MFEIILITYLIGGFLTFAGLAFFLTNTPYIMPVPVFLLVIFLWPLFLGRLIFETIYDLLLRCLK